MSKLNTKLAKDHYAVIKAAPASMRERLTRLAIIALDGAHEDTGDVRYYLDGETLYYSQIKGEFEC